MPRFRFTYRQTRHDRPDRLCLYVDGQRIGNAYKVLHYGTIYYTANPSSDKRLRATPEEVAADLLLRRELREAKRARQGRRPT